MPLWPSVWTERLSKYLSLRWNDAVRHKSRRVGIFACLRNFTCGFCVWIRLVMSGMTKTGDWIAANSGYTIRVLENVRQLLLINAVVGLIYKQNKEICCTRELVFINIVRILFKDYGWLNYVVPTFAMLILMLPYSQSVLKISSNGYKRLRMWTHVTKSSNDIRGRILAYHVGDPASIPE